MGPRNRLYILCYCLSRPVVPLFSDSTNYPFQSKPQATLKLRVSLSDLMQRFLAVAFGGRGGVGVGSGRYFFFHRDPNLLSAALVVFV